ncbi:MAG: TaqI family restriction endonuclease [Flammeovirgaceae bacterium]
MANITELVNFLATLELNPSLAKIKTVEVDLKGGLNPTLWLNDVFFEKNQWLGFKAFYEYYVSQNEGELKQKFSNISWEDLKKGLEARLYRTQFGMLTEYHAYFLCKNIFGENNVIRNADLDRIGVDFQLLFNNEWYNIHIFVDTNRAWEYRRFKAQNKQSNVVKGLHINLPYSLARNRFNSLEYLPNGFGIYSSRYLEYLKNEILLGNIKNDNIIGTNSNGFIYKT